MLIKAPDKKNTTRNNQKCVEYLNKYQTLSYVQGSLVISGLGMIIGAFSQIEEGKGLSSGGKMLMVVGGITINSTWIPHFMKREIIENALKEYNK